MKSAFEDRPYSLDQPAILKERVSMLELPHVAPLTSYVRKLRSEKVAQSGVPHFDPLDGGIDARLLIVLETPGRKAVKSGFISQNNPDPTAKNIFCALRQERIERTSTALWNIVPWNLSSENSNRNATDADARHGVARLISVLSQFRQLTDILLCGRKAEIAFEDLSKLGKFRTWRTPHFSNQAYGHRHLREKCHDALQKISIKMIS